MNEPDDLEPHADEIPPTASPARGGDEDAPLNEHLAVDIDPDLLDDLLEAALASAERSVRRPARAPDAAPARPAPRDVQLVEERTLALQARIREQGERLLRLDDELRRVLEARALAEAQLVELRAAFRTQSDDFDRFRQRSRKEREEAERVGEERLLRSFIETAGNVERAWRHADAGPEHLMAGLHMIVEQFRGVLKRAGLERIHAQPGTRFDPEVHEAVLHVPHAEFKPGEVVDEATPGWRLRGRLFLAARVTVAAAPPTEERPGSVTLDGHVRGAPAPPDSPSPSAGASPPADEPPPETQE